MATSKKATKVPAKSTTPAKKQSPAKQEEAAKKKETPAKKAEPAKKTAVPAAKAAAPAKKAEPAKVVAPPAKKAAPAKKTAPAKPAEAAVKTAPAKKEAAKPAPATPPAKPAPVKKEAVAKPAPVKKAGGKTGVRKVEAPKREEIPMRSNTPHPPQKKRPVVEEKKIVKMPTISAKGKVDYDPDFTVSVLDTPKEEVVHSTPMMRYSDSDLAEFRELILRKLEAARKELAYLQGLITRKDDMGGDNDDSRYMTMEDGTLSMEREQLSQMASRQIQFIDHLEKALMRIESKTYGICRVTGKLIDKARLRAVPHATLSMEAKLGKR